MDASRADCVRPSPQGACRGLAPDCNMKQWNSVDQQRWNDKHCNSRRGSIARYIARVSSTNHEVRGQQPIKQVGLKSDRCSTDRVHQETVSIVASNVPGKKCV